jgi:hypothetical protein
MLLVANQPAAFLVCLGLRRCRPTLGNVVEVGGGGGFLATFPNAVQPTQNSNKPERLTDAIPALFHGI